LKTKREKKKNREKECALVLRMDMKIEQGGSKRRGPFVQKKMREIDWVGGGCLSFVFL
jgi:hypothetical protein